MKSAFKTFIFATAILILSNRASAEPNSFSDADLKLIETWNSCTIDGDCISTHFGPNQIQCPSPCGRGSLLINKKHLKEFARLKMSRTLIGAEYACAEQKCVREDLVLQCINKKCAIKK
jgi:hypothetical protein